MTTLKLKEKKYDFLVFIGRFQPAHNAHIEIIEHALTLADNVIICIGSAFQPRTPKDPFTAEEREEMISSVFDEDVLHRLFFRYVADKRYNDQQWALDIQDCVQEIVHDMSPSNSEPCDSGYDNTVQSQSGWYRSEVKIGIIGHQKDYSTFYLAMFPQWDFINTDNIHGLHATSIRDYYFNTKWDNNEEEDIFVEMCEEYLNKNIFDFLINFRNREEFNFLREEFSFIEKYKSAWADSPYPPTFVTCDAVVVQSGHVLLVQRRASPGAGLKALVGGFVNQDETVEDAMLRELREETKIKVPEPVLRGSIKARKIYDAPNRSLRGRTITHAFLIELNPGPLPKVKGGDDAVKAFWVPLNEVNPEEMFEDHAEIIADLVGRL